MRSAARLRKLADAGLAPARYAKVIQTEGRNPLLQVLKTAAAAAIAWTVGLILLPGQLPVFAAVAAIIVVQPSVNQTFAKGLERTVGVIAGVVVASLTQLALGDSAWVVLIAIVVSLMVGWALRFSQTTTVQIPISAMLVLAIGAQTPGYAVERILETILGALIAIVINVVVVPPVRIQPAHDAVIALGREVANSLDDIARLIETPSTSAERMGALVEARLLTAMLAKARAAVTAGEESLRFNPRGGAHQRLLETDEALLTTLQVLVSRVPGMVRAINDHYDETLHTEPTAAGLGTELRRASHDLRLVVEGSGLPGVEPLPVEDDVPALTSQLRVLRPSQTHWVLIGSLMEDLRRVHEVIVDAMPDREADSDTQP